MDWRRRIGWAALLLAVGFVGGCDIARPDVVVGEATVESIEIAILESFPVRVHTALRGSVPDACAEVDTIEQHRDEDRFLLVVRTRRPADEVCAQVVMPFEATGTLAVLGLPAGPYTVTAGEAEAGFDLTTDNLSLDGTTRAASSF